MRAAIIALSVLGISTTAALADQKDDKQGVLQLANAAGLLHAQKKCGFTLSKEVSARIELIAEVEGIRHLRDMLEIINRERERIGTEAFCANMRPLIPSLINGLYNKKAE